MSPTHHFHDRHAKPYQENASSSPQLKINKTSHMIKKSSSPSSPPTSSTSSSSSSASSLCMVAPAKVAPQQRHPVIIYTHSPKVIHTHPKDFRALVQKLTGMSRSEEAQDQKKPQMKAKNSNKTGGEEEEDHERNNNSVGARINNAVDDNDSISSVITADENCGSIGTATTDHGQVNSCFLPPTNIYEPYMANIPVFTPNSADFLCSNPAFYNYTDSIFFRTPNIRNNSSTLEGINEFREY